MLYSVELAIPEITPARLEFIATVGPPDWATMQLDRFIDILLIV